MTQYISLLHADVAPGQPYGDPQLPHEQLMEEGREQGTEGKYLLHGCY